MKFGQLLEYNMANIFPEISNSKCGGETIPRPFYQNQIEHTSGPIVYTSFIQFVYIVYQVEGYRNIIKLSCRQLVFNSFKAFIKTKRMSGTSFLASFSA